MTLPVICRSVGQTSYSILPLPTQQWWVPGGTKNWNIVNGISCRKCAEVSPEEDSEKRRDHIRESSNTMISDYKHTHVYTVLSGLLLFFEQNSHAESGGDRS